MRSVQQVSYPTDNIIILRMGFGTKQLTATTDERFRLSGLYPAEEPAESGDQHYD